jgi:DNA-binding GntR family transcriptional regulator
MAPQTYRTMAGIAAQTIKEAIFSAQYPPGKRLVPAKLEQELELGRIAIREALKELTSTGLLVSVPNKGAVVAQPPEMEEIEQIFEIRFLLEGKASRLATPRIAPEFQDKLEELHRRMSLGTFAGHEYSFLNREFHIIIYQASGWKFLCQVITQLIEKVHAFRGFYPFRKEDFQAFNQDHEEILSAIRDRNAERVSELTVRNVQRGFETLKAVYEKKRARGGAA